MSGLQKILAFIGGAFALVLALWAGTVIFFAALIFGVIALIAVRIIYRKQFREARQAMKAQSEAFDKMVKSAQNMRDTHQRAGKGPIIETDYTESSSPPNPDSPWRKPRDGA